MRGTCYAFAHVNDGYVYTDWEGNNVTHKVSEFKGGPFPWDYQNSPCFSTQGKGAVLVGMIVTLLWGGGGAGAFLTGWFYVRRGARGGNTTTPVAVATRLHDV